MLENGVVTADRHTPMILISAAATATFYPPEYNDIPQETLRCCFIWHIRLSQLMTMKALMLAFRVNTLMRLTPLRGPVRFLPTAGKRSATIYRCISSTSSAIKDDKFQMLQTLPEYNQARESALKGQFMQAVPLYTRVIEVLESSMGKESELTLHAVTEQVKTLLNNGDVDKAMHILRQTKKTVGVPTHGALVEWGLLLAQLDALAGLKSIASGTPPPAIDVVDSTTVDTLMTHPATPLDAISPTYGLKGLVYLSRGEVDRAEDELQLAARWAQTPDQRLVALTNLGALYWTKLALTLRYPSYQPFRRRDVLHFGYQAVAHHTQTSSTTTPPSVLFTPDQRTLMQEALAYWEEAIKEATMQEGASDPVAAASACGPNAVGTAVTVPSSASSVGSGTSSSGGSNSSSSSSCASSSSSGTVTTNDTPGESAASSVDALTSRLQDADFVCHYVQALCNAATARTFLASATPPPPTPPSSSSSSTSQSAPATTASTQSATQSPTQSSAQTTATASTAAPTPLQQSYHAALSAHLASAEDHLTAAIQAVSTHVDALTRAQEQTLRALEIAQQQPVGAYQYRLQPVPTTEKVGPALGRALAQLAGVYLHPQRGQLPDPVTAEGLLRAGLDKLNGPYALKDKR